MRMFNMFEIKYEDIKAIYKDSYFCDEFNKMSSPGIVECIML